MKDDPKLLAECAKALLKLERSSAISMIQDGDEAAIIQAIVDVVRPHVLAAAAAVCQHRALLHVEREKESREDSDYDDAWRSAAIHQECELCSDLILALATPSKAQAETKETK